MNAGRLSSQGNLQMMPWHELVKDQMLGADQRAGLQVGSVVQIVANAVGRRRGLIFAVGHSQLSRRVDALYCIWCPGQSLEPTSQKRPGPVQVVIEPCLQLFRCACEETRIGLQILVEFSACAAESDLSPELLQTMINLPQTFESKRVNRGRIPVFSQYGTNPLPIIRFAIRVLAYPDSGWRSP